MRVFPAFLPPLTVFSMTTVAMGTGCSASSAGGALAGAALTAAGILLYEKLVRSRPALPGSAVGRPPAPPVSPEPPSAMATKLVAPEVSVEEAVLRDRLRFTGPYRVRIDLVHHGRSPVNFRIGRRERDGLTWEDGGLILGLNDLFVSTDHAGISLMRTADQNWGLTVGDRSTNGTEVVGFGNLRGKAANYRVTPEHPGVRIQAGRYEIEFVLNNPTLYFPAPPAPAKMVPWTPPVVPSAARPAAAQSLVPLPPAPAPKAAAAPATVVSPAPTPALDPLQVRLWIESAVQADKSVTVAPSGFGVTVQIRSKDPLVRSALSLHFPNGTTEASVRCVCDFLDKHCHLFRPSGTPTMNVGMGWSENANPYGVIAIRGANERNTVAASLGDRVSGRLTEADLLNVGGLPEVSIVFPFDPEPSAQVIRMVEQIRDAFKRIRDALGHVHARWEVIDPMAVLFDGSGT